MKKYLILIIEDEPDILAVIEYNLRKEGYDVISSTDGEKGLGLVMQSSPDLVLLDLMLPGLDGLEVCRKVKENRETRAIPIIMVTAKGEESDIVLGLGIGADDYVVKPFSPKELISRVKAVLRRGGLKEEIGQSPKIKYKELEINPVKFEASVEGQSLPLTLTEFKLLHYLASHPGRVFTRDQLLNAAIDDKSYVLDRNIDVHVRAIRQKLGDYDDIIETVRGVGYRFIDMESS
jgi:DNA-binding response OmpR family regulator